MGDTWARRRQFPESGEILYKFAELLGLKDSAGWSLRIYPRQWAEKPAFGWTGVLAHSLLVGGVKE